MMTVASDSVMKHQDRHDYLRMILSSRVYDAAIETPLQYASSLSQSLSNSIWLKREDLQPVFSFKLRGAYNKMAHLSPSELSKGVIAVSAGNHAQGVAMAAYIMKVNALIVMPVTTPAIKHEAVRQWGVDVLLAGNDFEEARQKTMSIVAETGRTLIHPFDDPYVIAGQGTIAVEIMRQIAKNQAAMRSDPGRRSSTLECSPDVEYVFVAVGGGGMIAGIGAYLKRIYPNVKVVAVETYDADSLSRSLKAGRPVALDRVGLFADGAAVRQVGDETFRLCQEVVNDVVLVSTDEICAAIKDAFTETRAIMEPAGALSIAGMKNYLQASNISGKTCVAVTCGANMPFDRLRFVAERARLGEQKEVLLSVSIPEKPGAFLTLYNILYPRSITEFNYRFDNPTTARILLSFEVNDRNTEVANIIKTLSENGMRARDLSQNELAKTHARYMIGGRAKVPHERLYQFSIPEQPGALLKFLTGLHPSWNVSLFQYRNSGGDVAKILAGIQVPPEDTECFETFVKHIGYDYEDLTNDPVYEEFFVQ